jgi:hypothetical protein
MNETEAGELCRVCGEDVTYINAGQGGAWNSGWRHVATGKSLGSRDDSGVPHSAAPAPRCPECKSTEYGSEDTPWGIAWDCRACGHHVYHSIGD